MNKNFIVIVILIILIAWGFLDLKRESENTTNLDASGGEVGLNIGNIAPNFELETLEGDKLALTDLRGKKVILNLWATWCPPCRAEMPHMQDFYENYKEEGVEILAVNLTTQERNMNAVKPFVYDEFQLSFPVVLDIDGSVRKLYQAYSIPTTYLIDTQGRVQKRVIGPMSYEMMVNMVNSID